MKDSGKSPEATKSAGNLAMVEKITAIVLALARRPEGTTFAEIHDRLEQEGIDPRGNATLELRRNDVLWQGCSAVVAGVLLQLIHERRVFLWPAHWLAYVADGAWPTLPIAKQPPPNGYDQPHWLPAVLRALPIPEDDAAAMAML